MPPRRRNPLNPPLTEPLDAYITAKPDEPTFTLQGGDAFSPHLVRLWAAAARAQTGLRIHLPALCEPLAATLINRQIFGEEAIKALRLRATAAEEVSWRMDEYLSAGSVNVNRPEIPVEKSLTESARIDLHDFRVRAAQRISGMFSELADIRDELEKRAALSEGLSKDLIEAIGLLKDINAEVEPRRLFK